MSLGFVLPVVALLAATPQSAPPPQPAAPQIEPAATPPAGSSALDPLGDPLRDPAEAPEAAPTVRHRRHAPGDSLEGFNRRMFAAYQAADRHFLRPAAMGYKHVVPKPARTGLRHVFSNVGEPIVFLNDLLQFKPGRATKTLARFLINSTLGLGGLLDIAKLPNVGLPHHPNGFGDTLGYYGVGPGPYLFLPFGGPSTLRDFLGGQGDALVLPIAVGNPFDRWQYQVPKAVVTGLDQRAEADADLKALFDGAVDPYATLRSVYLQNRAAEIEELHHRHAKDADPLIDPLQDPAASTGPSPLDAPLTDPAAGPVPPKP